MEITDVKRDTIVRTIVLLFALINQALTVAGYPVLPISDEQINELVTLIITISASIWTWWKNNSFTKEAVEADEYLQELKKER